MLPPPSYYNVDLPPDYKDISLEFRPSTSTPPDDPNSKRGAPSLHDSNPRIKVPPSLLDQVAVCNFLMLKYVLYILAKFKLKFVAQAIDNLHSKKLVCKSAKEIVR